MTTAILPRQAATLTTQDSALEQPPKAVRRKFCRDLHAPEASRNFTIEFLGTHRIASDVLDNAVLLVDEAVTNAALYAGRGHITVEITVEDKQIRFGVTDAGRARADVAMDAEFDEDSEGGRGWFLIDALSTDCGIERLGGGNGNRAWFVIDREPGGAL